MLLDTLLLAPHVMPQLKIYLKYTEIRKHDNP